MKGIQKTLSWMLTALMVWGCDKPQKEEPDVPQNPVADFVLAVSDVTAVSCHFSVTPKDEQMPYVVMLVEKSDFDSYEDEYKYQDNDLEWFQQKAMEEGKDLDEWLKDFLHTGHFEADEKGLMPGTSYYLYAYGLDYEGYFLTGVTKMEFSTPEIVQKEMTFEIDVTDVGLSKATVSVQASEETGLFFMNVFSQQQYQEWGGDETAFANHAAALVDYYVTMGRTLEEIVTNLGSVGMGSMIFDDLIADTEYIAYAVGIDENFFVNTKATVVRFTTKKAAQSSNTFTVDITGTTFCSVQGTVTPSNDDPYICTIQPKAQLDNYSSDEEIMYEIVAT